MIPATSPTAAFTHLTTKETKPWAVTTLQNLVATVSPQNAIKSGVLVKGGTAFKLQMSGPTDFIVGRSDAVHQFLAKHGVNTNLTA